VAFAGRSAFVSVPAAVASLAVWGVGSLSLAVLAVHTHRG
jgi:hypothetical protein